MPPNPTITAEYVDLAALGAKPMHVDPTFDNTVIFNRLFERFGRDVFESIRLKGRYRHLDTLVFPARMSAAIEGTAGSFTMADLAYTGNGQGGATCGFIYGGPPDRPMIRLKGSMVRFTGIHFQGYHAPLHNDIISKPPSAFAPVALQVETNQNSLATGYPHLAHCSFAACQTAIQCGESNPTAHNAEGVTSSGTVWVSYCGAFMRVRNNQSVVHNLHQVILWNTEVGFDLERGGGLTVGSCEVVGKWTKPCILLQTDKVDVNTGRINLGDVKLDNTADGCQVLNMKSVAPLHLSMGLHVGNGINSAPLFTLRGNGARVRLNEVMGLTAKSFKGAEGRPSVTIDGGTTRKGVLPVASSLVHPESRSPLKFTLWDLNEGVG